MAPRRRRQGDQHPIEVSRVDEITVGGNGSRKWKFKASVDPWALECEARMVQGRLDVTKLTIEADPRPPSLAFDADPVTIGEAPRLTSEALRAISPTRILEAFRAHLLDEPEGPWHDDPRVQEIVHHLKRTSRRRPTKVSAAARALGQRGTIGPRPRRKRRGADHYRHVAERRLVLEREQTGKGVNAALAREFQVNQETIRDWLARCRDLRYLAPGRQGQRSAFPGERLLEEWQGGSE